MYQRITTQHVNILRDICGSAHVLADEESLRLHGRDYTEDLLCPPEVVVLPETAEQVSAILQLANRENLPVTPRGAGTGLSGGALPVMGGICLSVARMNRILHIDTDNAQVTTEPGVITQVLQEAVEAVGLYYPPDPASRGSCFIGGNIAENSGGPRAVKYGVVKDYVLNLEVVLPTGDIVWTGANTLKNSTGYNLTQLMVGSEGTLGIVTKAVLKLIPKPTRNLTLLAPFTDAGKACEAVAAIFQAGITPSAMEFMERDAILFTLPHVEAVELPLYDDTAAHLLIEVDGFHEDLLMADCEKIVTILEQFGAGEALLAQTPQEKDKLWQLRRKVGEAVKQQSIYKEEDTVVPRARLAELLRGVKAVGATYGFQSVCYGHAGDGNLHVNILKGNLTDHQWHTELPLAIREIFALVKQLGGTLSGEHGIGLVQKDYMDIFFTPLEITLMRGIKQLFDPNQILNPGKIWPEEPSL